jgi:uncharacterized membrane protein
LIYYGTSLHNLEKYLIVGSQILTIIGLLFILKNQNKLFNQPINKEYLQLGILASMILIACYTVPRFSALLYYARFFHFTTIFLCGFLLLGIVALVHAVKLVRWNKNKLKMERTFRSAYWVGAIFVVILLAFNTSAIYKFFPDQYSNSYTLDETVSWAIYQDTDVQGAKWLSMESHNGDKIISADLHYKTIFIGESTSFRNLRYQWDENATDSLIYLSDWNNHYNYAYTINSEGPLLTYTPITEVFDQVNDSYSIIYDTGSSTSIIYVPPSSPDTNGPGPAIFVYENEPVYVMTAVFASLIALGLTILIIGRYRK